MLREKMPWTTPGQGTPSGIGVDVGARESGKKCPNCSFPIENPCGTQVAAFSEPVNATWTCSHCGWTMTASRHGRNDRSPAPGYQ